jgi:hypothetical protein
MQRTDLRRRNLRVARNRWEFGRGHIALQILEMYSQKYRFSLSTGDLLFLNQNWYVTHAGLLRLSHRRHCRGIEVHAVPELCNTGLSRYAFRATVYTSSACKGFVGFGDADPSNVSPLVHGAEMRVAETRASTGPYARPTASGSAPSKRSGRSPNRLRPPASRRSSQPSPSMGITAGPRSATASAS